MPQSSPPSPPCCWNGLLPLPLLSPTVSARLCSPRHPPPAPRHKHPSIRFSARPRQPDIHLYAVLHPPFPLQLRFFTHAIRAAVGEARFGVPSLPRHLRRWYGNEEAVARQGPYSRPCTILHIPHSRTPVDSTVRAARASPLLHTLTAAAAAAAAAAWARTNALSLQAFSIAMAQNSAPAVPHPTALWRTPIGPNPLACAHAKFEPYPALTHPATSRRRATSHRRFLVRRRPNLRLAQLYGTTGSGRCTTGTTAAAAVAGRDAGRSVRQRTAVEPEPAAGAAAGTQLQQGEGEGGAGLGVRPTNRSMRRRPARLQEQMEGSCARDLAPAPGCAAYPTWTTLGGPAAAGVEQQARGLAAAAGGGGEAAAAAAAAGETGGGGKPACGMEVEAEGQGQGRGQGEEQGEALGQGVGGEGAAVGGCGPDPRVGVRRLESHTWHARRLAMEERWGRGRYALRRRWVQSGQVGWNGAGSARADGGRGWVAAYH